jgi:hypothetical protein
LKPLLELVEIELKEARTEPTFAAQVKEFEDADKSLVLTRQFPVRDPKTSLQLIFHRTCAKFDLFVGLFAYVAVVERYKV